MDIELDIVTHNQPIQRGQCVVDVLDVIGPIVEVNESFRSDMIVVYLDGFWMVELFILWSHTPDLFLCPAVIIYNDSNL
jgi:hypothetical protein